MRWTADRVDGRQDASEPRKHCKDTTCTFKMLLDLYDRKFMTKYCVS